MIKTSFNFYCLTSLLTTGLLMLSASCSYGSRDLKQTSPLPIAVIQTVPAHQLIPNNVWSKSTVPLNKWGDVIAFDTKGTIIIAGKGTLLASYDDGNSWEELRGGQGSYSSTVDGGLTLQSNDVSGKSSTSFISSKGLCSVESAVIMPSGRLYLKAVCEHITQLWSVPIKNEGEAWHVLSFSYPKDPSDGVYGPGHKLVIDGNRVLISATLSSGPALLTTDNDGIQWYPFWRGSGDSSNIIDLDFTSNGKGWILLGDGTLLSTGDGGRIWKRLSMLPNEFARKAFSIDFANAETGFITGLDGLILKSIDGGLNWRRQSSDVTFSLHKVVTGNTDCAWAIGGHGTVLQTVDGGVHWQKIELGIKKDLFFSLSMKNNIAWVIADQAMYYSPPIKR